MKKTLIVTLLAGLGLLNLTSAAEKQAGPKGGKLYPLKDGFIEFFVGPDRKVEVLVYDSDQKPAAVGDRELTITAGSRENPEKLAVEKTDKTFVTTNALPKGDGYPIILQLRDNANSKPQTFRISYLEEICSGCNLPEYACTCDHAH